MIMNDFIDEVVEHRFDFYTYDFKGNDIVISLVAPSEEYAWCQFRKVAYSNASVDFVKRVENSGVQ